MKLKTNTTMKSICLAAGAVMAMTSVNAQEDFKPSGNLWGYMFGDYAYKTHNDTLSRGAGNVQYKTPTAINSSNTVTPGSNPAPANTQSNAFQIRRVYLGYDYKFAPNLSANVVLAHEETGTGQNNNDAGTNNSMYVKYANLKWSMFKNTDLVIGQYSTASFATPFGTEPLWGYRSIERTLLDLHNIDGSSDMGLSLQGKAWVQGGQPDSLKPTFVGYLLQVGNGNSAKMETDAFKKWRLNLFVSLMSQKLTIGLYGDYVNSTFTPIQQSNTTVKAYASFKTEKFRVGAEWFQQTNLNSDVYKVADATTGVIPAGTANSTTSGVQMGWSVFASANIIPNKLNVFARFDMYNPDTKYNKDNVYSSVAGNIKNALGLASASPLYSAATFYNQTFITGGIDWTPNSRFHIMPNIWFNQYATMMTTAGASGTGNDLSARVQKDNDMVYRVTFYFLFNGNKKVSNNGMY